MGFMDKAKQMAEQAQQKIEETQKQFNEGQAEKATTSQGASQATVRYDSSGRPIEDAPPAAGVPAAPVPPAPAPGGDAGAPPASDPATAVAVAVPQPPESLDAPEVEAGEVTEEAVPAPAPPKEGMNATPDPFKPIG